MTAPTNPLVDDRDVELILDEVLDLGRLRLELAAVAKQALAGELPRGRHG